MSNEARRQAEADWKALANRCIQAKKPNELVVREGVGRAASAWPTSQVISAALGRAVAQLGTAKADDAGDDFLRLDAGLRHFQTGSIFTESRSWSVRRRPVFYDDNAWIALNFIQVALLQLHGVLPGDPMSNIVRARGVLALLVSGQDTRDGGVSWKVGGDTRNACSTAPSGLLALRIVEAERNHGGLPQSDHAQLIAFAQRCAGFIDLLRDSRGLIADHLRPDGQIEPSIYSYNQGTGLGLSLQLHRVTHDEVSLQSARLAAAASIEYYSDGDRLWRESPAFVAIFLRHLAVLRAYEGSDTGLELTDRWLDRLTTQGLDPATGFYSRGGIGRYDGSVSLDQAGIVAARYTNRWPAGLVRFLC